MASHEDDDLTPKDNKEYKTKEYWDQRYQKDKGLYDWFKGYSEFQKLVNKYIQKENSILNVGCGNSALSEKMYEDGYHQITNIDFSEIVIQDMLQKYSHLEGLQWKVMDAMDMTLDSNSFDVVLEKGTIDALMCDQVSAWEVPEDIENSVDKMCSEISRVLKPGGLFISITFAQPHFRKKLIMKEKYGWDVTIETIVNIWEEFVHCVEQNAFLVDLLASSFHQAFNISPDFIKETIKEDKVLQYPTLVTKAREESEKPKTNTQDDNEFLPFMCMGEDETTKETTTNENKTSEDNNNNNNNTITNIESRIIELKESSIVTDTCNQFIQSSFKNQLFSLSQQYDPIHPLALELYHIHKEARDFETIKSILGSIIKIFSQNSESHFPQSPEEYSYLKKQFINNGWLCLLTVLCFSYHDGIRDKATEGLMVFADSPSSALPSKTKIDYMATTMSLFQYDIPRWYDDIKEHTFATRILPLSKREGFALAHAFLILFIYEIFRHQLGLKQDHEELETITQLEKKLDKIIETDYNGKCFAKLSSRSPKDSIFEQERFIKLNEADLKEYKEKHGCEEVPKLISQGIAQKNAALAMVVTSGKEVLDLFMTSVRCYQDIKSCLDLSPHFFVSIVLREWCYCPVDREFRGFVRGGKLNALSQYFSKSYFPQRPQELVPHIKDRVIQFHESVKTNMKLDNYVMDFLVLDDKVQIIEVNCYGKIAGPALFDWDKDFERLLHGPCELRLIVDQNGTVLSL